MFAKRTNWNLAANRLSEALARHRASGKPLYDLTASNPTECGFAYDKEVILAALRNPAALRYEPNPQGLESARLAVTEYYSARSVTVSAHDMVLTASTSEAYSFVFRLLCDPGDELLIPAPSYPLFGFLADVLDVKLVRYPLLYDHGWQIDFHSLEQAITLRTRGVIVVNPNNPTGHFVKPKQLAKLNALCVAGELALIADEVFLDFALGDATPVTCAGNPVALTFAMSGLSKIAGLPQMKMAWLIASGPAELKRCALEKLEVIADTYLSPNAPVQLAAPTLLELRRVFQKQLKARVRRNLAELDRQLAQQQACTRLDLEGGWYATLRVPAVQSDEDLAVTLLETKGVYVHPGHFFDFRGEGFLVFSLIAGEEEFDEGIRRLLAAV
ncbi:MAG TPA: pyridoxal phosphate-dependent aminotransferase [Candidatus Acidoferrum sp.]|nr:pyridoxal phosphate-dependent aminotransferase [Candidatus Acidoferrum sp.]